MKPEKEQVVNALMGLTEECTNCGRAINDEDFVVNWGSCNYCFDTSYEYYLMETRAYELLWPTPE